MSWNDRINELTRCLSKLTITSEKSPIDVKAGFKDLCYKSNELKLRRGTIFIVGNGASASMASHVAADLAKNAHIRTEVFSDLALITAVANDICYEQVFAEPLRRRMKAGDMLVGISSSGNSLNVINAATAARELGGEVITLTAMEPNNKLRQTGSLNFYLPGETYGVAESGHAAVLHYWIDMMVADCWE